MENTSYTYNMNQDKSFAILNKRRSYKIIFLCSYRDHFLKEV